MRSHMIIKVFPSYPLLSWSISTRHITKTSRGGWRNQYPWSLSTGVHALLSSRQELGNKWHWLARSHVTCEWYSHLWLRLKLRWSKRNNDPWCERQYKYLNSFSLDHFGIMIESMESHRAWMETSDWMKGCQKKPERLSELLNGL